MGVGKNEITELEKAAIYYGVFHGLNIESIYKIVNPTGNPEYMRQKGNQWRRTNRICEYYQTIITLKKNKKTLGFHNKQQWFKAMQYAKIKM